MAMNPASLMKMMTLKNKFEKNHPKFFAFLGAVFSRPIEEGTIMELTGSKLGKKYKKAVYCHPVYLTYIWSTS